MFITMGVGLFTSRVIIDALGISDYGIYNVVGGFVSMFTILTGSLSVATSRFLTHALGTNDLDRLKRTFSTSINIHIALSFFILLVSEIIGYWFLNNKLNIPVERMYAANWVLQFSIFSFIINLINVPYTSSIISHEKMGIYAYLSLFDVTIKLLIVYALYTTSQDKLIIYALLFLVTNVITQLIYWLYCKKRFIECKYKLHLDKTMLKEMSSFIGWAFWGNAVVILKDQGMTILINIFLGTLINAAQGVANQVNSIVNRFVNNFMVAVNPQITKFYAAGNIKEMNTLIIRSTKLSVFLMLILMTPIIINIDSILSLWLVEVPKHTNNLISIILFYSLVECFTSPLVTGILASGKIKIFEICLTITYLANFIVMYILLKFEYGVESVYFSLVIFKVIVLILQLYLGGRIFSFSINSYIKVLIRYIMPVLSIAILFIILSKNLFNQEVIYIVYKSVIAEIILLSAIISFGITCDERKYILIYIKNKIQK